MNLKHRRIAIATICALSLLGLSYLLIGSKERMERLQQAAQLMFGATEVPGAYRYT